MKTKCPIGTFSFDENGELADYKLFSRNGEKAAGEFLSSKDADPKAVQMIRKRMRSYALDLQFAANDQELNEFLYAFALALSGGKMKGIISADKVLVQAFNALDNMNETINTFSERLREWYTLHYPETKMGQRELAEAVLKYGRRDNFPGFGGSVGANLSEKDLQVLKNYAAIISDMAVEKKEMERYVKETVRAIAPNFSSLIDEMLAVRFIALAGGLEKIARMPASTVQLLGAEKALFRHLKKLGKSPKYGILYMDSRIQNAAPEKKGKIARVIAAKLMLAARIDFYSGRIDEKIKADMEKELKGV